ncbi:transcriptional adapter 2-alpha-like isoform X1 [Athalia rosae]|uniref:transcriptional adapter 2-alpha-like isoform X1 n=1 Tax=Athalia rosae TaxID=37344 RepID=UPI000A0EDCEC|nr:transcriptional adapter 2-alpha-like isoform X1 [Athalia rosae]
MANPNIMDMTEEDAAGLQFPKDCPSSFSKDSYPEHDVELEVSVVKEELLTSDPVCSACKLTLSEPYIRCVECRKTEICSNCFSNGAESNTHKNNHSYVIIKNEFPIICGSSWSARQELELLDALQECGFGNWVDISRRLQNKTPEECKKHYLEHYIDNQSLPGLPKIKETTASLFCHEVVPYLYKLQDLEEPPRFATNTINSKFLAGYNAARSDFEINFDDHAESLISDLKYDEFCSTEKDYELGRELQIAIVKAYNHRLEERRRRRRIMRDHGLISFRRTMTWLHRI